MTIAVLKSAIKDHYSNWDRHQSPPPVFDVAAYQAKLDEIAGKSRDRSILLLEWGGNACIQRYTGWDLAGQPVSEEFIPKYALKKDNELMDAYEYIPIRRWIIAQLQEPEQYFFGDDSDNTFTDERGINCVMAEKPKDMYTPLIYIGDHSVCPKTCCEKRICLGDYKLPGEPELDWVRGATFKLAQEYKIDPYSTLSQGDLDKIAKDKAYERAQAQQKSDETHDEYYKDWYKTHGHRFTEDDPGVLEHGRHHFFKDGKPI